MVSSVFPDKAYVWISVISILIVFLYSYHFLLILFLSCSSVFKMSEIKGKSIMKIGKPEINHASSDFN